MREESLLCHLKRQFVPTTDSHHPFQVYPNLVKGLEVDAPDVVWVADITYIREAPQLCIPGDLARRLFTQMRRMEPVQAHRYATGAGSFGTSPGDSRCETRTHSPFIRMELTKKHLYIKLSNVDKQTFRYAESAGDAALDVGG